MEWQQFAAQLLPILEQIIALLGHTTPEGRPHVVASTTGLKTRIEELRAALEDPKVKTDHDHPSARGRSKSE